MSSPHLSSLPQYEHPWELSMDPFFDEFVGSFPPPSLSKTHLCPVESKYPLRTRIFRQETAQRFQALWRGYRARQLLKSQNQQQVAFVEPIWAKLDEAYRISVRCQTLAVFLHEDDPSWDPTTTPYYQWMLSAGKDIEVLEAYLLKRGWVRPPKKPLSRQMLSQWMSSVFRKYL